MTPRVLVVLLPLACLGYAAASLTAYGSWVSAVAATLVAWLCAELGLDPGPEAGGTGARRPK